MNNKVLNKSISEENKKRFKKIREGAILFEVAPYKRNGNSDEEIIEFWSNIYIANPGDSPILPGGPIDETSIMFIGGFYNFYPNSSGTTKVLGSINNKCLIDAFGAGLPLQNDFYKKAGVYTDPKFIKRTTTHRFLVNYVTSNPDVEIGFDRNKIFDPVFIPGAYTCEREQVGQFYNSWITYNENNHSNVDPYYEAGTYFHFGKYGSTNKWLPLNSNNIKIYDSSIHGAVLAMVDYMPFRDYFRFKLNSVSPKFGLESVPEDPENLVLHGFRDYGATAGMGQIPHPGWAPCIAGTYQQWTEHIILPFFEQYGGQEVLPTLEQHLRTLGHTPEDVITGIPDENNMSVGHYDFFNNIVELSSNNWNNIFNNQALPTYGPLVYDFDCDGIWGENDIAIWEIITQYWSSLGDDVDNVYKPANYYTPATDTARTMINSFAGGNIFSPPPPQPPGIWNILQNVNSVDEEFNELDLPFNIKNKAQFNWNNCLNQIPYGATPTQGPPTSGVESIAPHFNLDIENIIDYDIYYNNNRTYYNNELINNPENIYQINGGNNGSLACTERPIDSFFPITKYWD